MPFSYSNPSEVYYIALRPLITRSKMAIMAITKRVWMIPPEKNPPKKLIAQMMTSTTAMIYRILPMIRNIKKIWKGKRSLSVALYGASPQKDM